MGRPKGSKNKSTLIKETKEKEKKDNPFAWNETIQKLTEDKKIQLNEASLTTGIVHFEEQKEFTEIKNKKKDNYPKCDRCGCDIYCGPIKIDTDTLTGKGEFWRSLPRKVQLCDKCAKELSDLIKEFLLEKGVMKTFFEK